MLRYWVGKYEGGLKGQPFLFGACPRVSGQPPLGLDIKKGVRIKIQPRFKIQYPMKNQGKDIRKHSYLQAVDYPGIANCFLPVARKSQHSLIYRLL
jgi:hypothetical protein